MSMGKLHKFRHTNQNIQNFFFNPPEKIKKAKTSTRLHQRAQHFKTLCLQSFLNS